MVIIYGKVGGEGRTPERIAHLVYVDSSAPIDGKSLYGMFEDPGISPAEHDLPLDPRGSSPCISIQRRRKTERSEKED